MEDFFHEQEYKDGVRLSWNLWPSSRVDYKKLVAPLASLYTPLKSPVTTLKSNPLQCLKCGLCLNPYCRIDFNTKSWFCPFCNNKNALPPAYAGSISQQQLPPELFPENTTVEYLVSQVPATPVFLFVIDTAITHQDELEHLKQALLQVLQVIPQNMYVGLITFGHNVQVYELSYSLCRRCIVFSGESELSPPNIQTLLGLQPNRGANAAPQLNNKYILQLSEIENPLISLIEELQQDPFPYKKGEERRACATGMALSVGLAMLECLFPKTPGRMIVISAGPCTVGPGLVVSRNLSEPIRSHYHLRKEEAKHVGPATAFYSKLAVRAVAQGHAVDIFSASLDQTGILEMHKMASHTGGLLVSTESFKVNDIIKQSLKKLFDKDQEGHLQMRFNSTIELITSKELKICGAIGHLQSAEKKSANISESVIGIGGTSMWKMSVLDSNHTYGFYFEVVNAHNNTLPADQYGIIQYRTTYQHPTGYRIQRVTTIARQWVPPSSGLPSLLAGFDQEACTSLIARYAVYKADNEETQPVRWIDRHLIQFMHQFAQYQKDVANSCQFPPQISLYPEFMFHLRRGNLIQVFGCSPDETAYFRHYLFRENAFNILIMIQPSLDSYAFDVSEPLPAPLSSASIKADQILLLDAFFHVLVFSGDTIAKWRKAGYQDQPGYESFKALLEAPLVDAENIIKNRYPTPMRIICDQGSGQARFLLAFLDPGANNSNNSPGQFVGTAPPGQGQGQEIYSEDVPLNIFLDHLKRKVVSYEA
jgi:protein transport protein SEC23